VLSAFLFAGTQHNNETQSMPYGIVIGPLPTLGKKLTQQSQLFQDGSIISNVDTE